METSQILAEIDKEIARLSQARALLTGSTPAKRGRKPTAAKAAKSKRTLSPEARKRIAEAQRKRWAAQKKAAKA
jgi:hypothetical protein